MVSIQFIHDKGEPVLAVQETHANTHRKLELIDKQVLPIAAIIMLFAIPYCATQSFLVSYIAGRHLNVTVSLFFPLYAVILLVLRLALRNLFDEKPFSFFLILSSISAMISITMLTVMKNNVTMFLAAAFMAGGYGIMCSVCQSKAIAHAGKEKRGLANSTYYIGLDLGMALGPIIGGELYGHIQLSYFYPILMVTVPLALLVYGMTHYKTVKFVRENGVEVK